MKISAVRVTPIAIKDPALLNAAGVHEPFGLRSIIEVVGANGMVGLGETYGDAPVLDLLTRVKDSLVGLFAFDVNGLLARVKAEAKLTKTAHVEMELAPGSMGDNLTSSVFSGFEVAFLDLQARSLGIPLVELLGGAVRKLPVQSDEILVGGQVPIVGGCVHVTDKPGLGVELDQAKLAELHQVFLNCRIRTRNDVTQMQKFRPEWSSVKPRF